MHDKFISRFLEQLRTHSVQFVDFRFTDLRGVWHHMTFPTSAVSASVLERGIYFDGSSIAGWRPIHQSDMLLKPDLERFSNLVLDPFCTDSTVIVVCDVWDPITHKPYVRDPRSIARRAEAYLTATEIADAAYFGPEPEFFVFDSVRYQNLGHQSFYEIESDEFPHQNAIKTGDDHGMRPSTKGGYFPVMPLDSGHDMRSEMLNVMQNMGIEMEKHHHEVAPAQHELGFRFDTLKNCADHLQIYKYAVRNVARQFGKTATFMPKPIYGDNGSGMHVHLSVWKDGDTLFAGDHYAGLSEMALYYIGGILKHAKSLNAFTNPTTNSYKRLTPGFEAPVICAYSAQNRSAACRIPLSEGGKATRIEMRFPDPTANGYLAFAALMMAGMDGIERRIHPGEPQTLDLYEGKEIVHKLPQVCGSLREALHHLEMDHDYLCRGDVFSKDLIEGYIELKMRDVYALDQHPHPLEFDFSYNL